MTLSLARITNLSYALVLLAVLCAAGGTTLVVHDLRAASAARAGESNVRLTSARIETLVARYKASARQLAARAAETGLLSEDKAVDRSVFIEQRAAALPQVLRLRLLPAGTRETDTASVPELSYACLDLLARSEQGKPIPDAEFHLPGTRSAHVDVSVPVQDPADKHVLGHVLLSVDPAVLRNALAAVKPADGLVELRQVSPKGDIVAIASGGDDSLRSGAPVAQQAIAGTSWQLAFWAPATPWSPSMTELGLYVALGLATLVVLALSVALPQRWLAAALRHDTEVLNTLFGDIRTGVLMGQYPFRLRELADLARQLRGTGEAIIEDRRNLEKLTQSDALTGLASRATFDAKLEQLHQQARAGLVSALLVTDIDHLDEINTQLGADAGDILLKQFARQLRDALRQSDIVARLGGGKLAVLFPFTDLEKIAPVVERLRQRLAEEFDPGSGMPRAFSWSAGLTLIGRPDRDPKEVLARADAALLEARRQGGNRTVTQPPPA